MPHAIKTVALLLALLGISQSSVHADLLVPFTLYAEHPDAVSQTTERGRTIRSIEHFNGKLYTGYGDWVNDTGPIEIRPLDLATGQFAPSSSLTYQTEAVAHFRGLNGSLYTTNIDPLGLAAQPAGYAIGDSSHNWNAVYPTLNTSTGTETLTATHVFDINRTSNGDIFMAGSRLRDAKVWRSVDGGQTFTVSLEALPPATPGSVFYRYTGVGVLNDDVYVQRVDFNVTAENQNTVSMRFDSATEQWVSGPNLIPNMDGFMARPEQFGDELVYLSSDVSDGFLYRFDGMTAQHALPGVVHDFQIVGDAIVALTVGGDLLFTDDFSSWTSLGQAPSDARSLEIVGDTVYVGTTSGQIFSASGLHSLPGVPEPGLSLPCLLAASLLLHRKRRVRPC